MSEPYVFKKMHLLEGARFVLAFLVVLWHYYYYGPLAKAISEPAMQGGVVLPLLSFAVEAFFMISGFVIIVSAEKRGAVDFAIQRFIRLAPALLICSSVTLLSCLVFDGLADINVHFRQYISSILVLPLYSNVGIDGSMWTLRFEVRFYIAIFILMLFVDIRKSIKLLAFSAVAAEFVLTLLEIYEYPIYSPLRWAKNYMGGYQIFFVMGMLIYAMKADGKATFSMLAAMFVGLGLSGYAAWKEANRIALMLHEPSVVLAVGLGVAIICFVFVLICGRSVQNESAIKWLSNAGAMSYPLYLIHQTFGYKVINYMNSNASMAGDPRPFVIAVMVLLSYVVALHGEPICTRFYRRVIYRVTMRNGRH